MSKCYKEKNNVYFSIDGVKGEYRFDIETGVLYGAKGGAIKYCPNPSVFCGTLRMLNTNLSEVLLRMFKETNVTAKYQAFSACLVAADRVDSIGVPNLNLGWTYSEDLDFLGKHIKELQEWGKNHSGNWEGFYINDFRMHCQYLKARKVHGSALDLLNEEMYEIILRHYPEPTTELLSFFGYYLGRGKYWEYHQGQLDTLIDYLTWCEVMDKPPQKTNNFMREWHETKQAYLLKKTDFDNKRIANNYAKHARAWEFTHGNYTIVVPACGQDIVDEGQNMHHCVGCYVDRVVNNSTYIVFVRRKDTPDKCHITCQVHTDGTIGQYYLAYDSTFFSVEDREFRQAFSEHLRSVWDCQ